MAMTFKPRSAASWVAKPPTPPAAPKIATVSPADASSASTAANAVPPAVGSAAAASADSASGRCTASAAVAVTYSAKLPSPWYGLPTAPKTSSPTAKPDTPEPRASTVPA